MGKRDLTSQWEKEADKWMFKNSEELCTLSRSACIRKSYLQACKVRAEESSKEIERLRKELSACQRELDRARGGKSWIESRMVPE